MARTGTESVVVPTVSGEQCARALERLGLSRCSEDAGVAWMVYGATFVAVPMCKVLPMETLVDIVEEIGIAIRDLVEQLQLAAAPASRAAVTP